FLTPSEQLGVAQAFEVQTMLPHWLGCVHSTQFLAPSQYLPTPWLHGVLMVAAGCDGVLPVQISSVHGLPSSSGVSLTSVTCTMLPSPSHWLCWQSPCVCDAMTVPIDGSFAPQTPIAEHVRVWQAVSVPEHCEGALHSTQV